MPFARPTLAELQQASRAEIASRLGLGTLVPRGNLEALANAYGGTAHLLHGHLDWLADQLFAETAESEYLDVHARFWLATARKAATAASGTILCTGLADTAVPLGTQFTRPTANGAAKYASTAAAILDGQGEASVPIEALLAGIDGNCDPGTVLSLAAPVAGLVATATVEDDGDGGGLTGGADRESDDDLRIRVLAAKRNPPGGGNAADWDRWTRETPGVSVTRVWVLPLWMGPGSVGVSFAVDNDPAGPLPDAGQVAAVEAYLETKRPVTQDLFVFSSIEDTLDPEIILTPDTPEVRAAVQANLADLLFRVADVAGGTVYLTWLHEAISTAAGEANHALVSPVADVSTDPGHLITLGTITWS